MTNQSLRDIAVNEVRGCASRSEEELLRSDIVAWRDALQSIIDDLDTQFLLNASKFADDTKGIDESSDEYMEAKAAYNEWRSNARSFMRHIMTRLTFVDRLCESHKGYVDNVVTAACNLVDVIDSDDEMFWNSMDALSDAVSALRAAGRKG